MIERGPAGRFGYRVKVAPTVKYARRLELGFDGADSLGRVYHQPPYPYFEPAYRFVVSVVLRPTYVAAWSAALRK